MQEGINEYINKWVGNSYENGGSLPKSYCRTSHPTRSSCQGFTQWLPQDPRHHLGSEEPGKTTQNLHILSQPKALSLLCAVSEGSYHFICLPICVCRIACPICFQFLTSGSFLLFNSKQLWESFPLLKGFLSPQQVTLHHLSGRRVWLLSNIAVVQFLSSSRADLSAAPVLESWRDELLAFPALMFISLQITPSAVIWQLR